MTAPGRRCLAALGLWAVLGAGMPGLAAEPTPSWALAVDSRALGTLTARGDLRWSGFGPWSWGVEGGISLPVFLVAKGGGWDTASVDLGGWATWAPGEGWFVRGRGTTGVVTQTQVLGTFTSWTASLALEPGYRAGWGELWLVVRPGAALVTRVQPSSAVAATFDDRYTDGPSPPAPSAVALGWSAFRVLVGVGAEFPVTPQFSWGLVLGSYPPLRSDWLGWGDGFSFGEIPFYVSLGCRLGP